MNDAFQSLSPAEAREAVLTSLGVSLSNAAHAAEPVLFAEAIRWVIWSYWATDQTPVYVTRIINAAIRLLYPWLLDSDMLTGEETFKKRLYSTLEELEIIGDIAALPRGRWLPAPLRVVPLNRIERWLLLGGVPTKLFLISDQQALEQTGIARFLTTSPDCLGLALDTQAEMEWRRTPAGTIDSWATMVLQNAPLAPVANQDERIEIYAPQLRSHTTDHYDRWVLISSKTRLFDGRHLARWKTRHGGFMHSIVEIQNQCLIASGRPNLGDGGIRRLMYGIDALVQRPIQIAIKRTSDIWRFKLRSEIPRAEHRLFVASGRLRPNPDGAYYPRQWEVSARYAPHIHEAITALGVTITEG